MFGLWSRIPGRVSAPGGSLGHLPEEIYREVAFIAYHFGWSRSEVMSMSHRERRQWINRISEINEKINASSLKGQSKKEEMNNVGLYSQS